MAFRYPIPPAIQWHEGMMLSPHHFQLQDLRLERMLAHHLHLQSFCHWGIHYLKLDPVVFPDGIVRVLSIEAVMPDGLIVCYEAGVTDEMPALEIDLRPFKPDSSNQEIAVHLCLVEGTLDQSPVLGNNPRMISIQSWINDLNTDDNPLTIPRLMPRAFLHVGDVLPTRAIGFPILKVIFQDEVFVSKQYTPARFFVERSSWLWEQCATIAQKIREKALYLCEKSHSQVGSPLLQETTFILKALLAGLPSLEAMLHGHPVSPYVLFQQLCQTLGHLSTLRLSQIPPLMSPYEHTNIDESFKTILNLIHEYILSIDQSYILVPFQKKERLFYHTLQASEASGKLYIGVRAPQGVSEKALEEWMVGAIIVSDFALEDVRLKRITGAPRTLVRDEKLYEMMPSRGVLLFEIQMDSHMIKPGQHLNIFNPADRIETRPSEIVLYLPRGG